MYRKGPFLFLLMVVYPAHPLGILLTGLLNY